MPIYQLKLLSKREVARETIELFFEKPPGFSFKPGQYGGFTLINPKETDAGGITRRFSIASTPNDNHIAIVTRIQNSAFKRCLSTLKEGELIKFAGPTGTFILDEDTAVPIVLIAGGIGIAPFYSMIKFATERHSPQSICLFYGNQSPKEAPFLTEIMALAKKNPALQLIPTMANPTADWQGEQGFITEPMIKKYVQNLAIPFYYICGSPVMVTTLQETLAEMGIDEDRIKVEDFPGY